MEGIITEIKSEPGRDIQDTRSFSDELISLINKHSKECGSNTPDFILAQYIEECLSIFETAVQQRETWHGRDPRPSCTRYGKLLSGEGE